MAIQRIERYGQFRPSPIDDSRARVMRQLAGAAGSLSDTARFFGEKRAAEEAPEKAQKAVDQAIQADPETGEIIFGELPKGKGYGKAVFDQAALNAYDAKINVAGKEKLINLQNENKDNPEEFLKQANAYTNAFLDSIPVPLRSKYESSMRNSVVSGFEQLNNEFLRNQTNQNIQTITNSITTLSDNAVKLFIQNSPDADEKLNEIFVQMDELKKLNPKFNVEKSKQELKNRIFEQSNIANLDKIAEQKGRKEAYEELNNILGNLPEGYSTEDAKIFERSAQENINRIHSRETAIKKTELEKNEQFVTSTVDAIIRGENVPDDTIKEAFALVEGTELEKTFLKAQEIAQFSVLSKEERSKIIEEEQNKPIRERSGLLNDLLKTNATINEELAKDPLGFAFKQKIITDEESQNFIDSIKNKDYTNSIELLKNRITKAQIAKNHYGESVPPFTDAEFDFISSAIDEMTPEDKTAFVGFINAGTEDTTLAANIYSKVASKNQGVFAQAGAMYSYNPTAVLQIFRGQQELKNKNITPLNAKDSLDKFQSVVGQAIEGSNDRKNVLETAKMFLYGDINNGQPNVNDLKDAILAITGNIQNVNNFKTILPDNVPSNRFDQYVNNFDVENSNIAEIDKVRAKRAFSNGKIEATKGINNYIVYGQDGQVIMDNSKPPQPFVFTVNKSLVDAFYADQYSGIQSRRKELR
jgi:hypothetical protein